MRDLSSVVKAYDVRGLVPDQLDEGVARALGEAFAQVTGSAGSSVVLGRDMRSSSAALAAAFAEGARDQGADVIDLGLASTDLVYFASGRLDLPGAMVTASHNPSAYNGIKLCRAAAVPIGTGSGLEDIRALAEHGSPPYKGRRGTVERRDLLDEYAGYLRSLVDLRGARPLTVVVDAANGMAGHTAPAVFANLPFDLVPMYFELDGTFPNHEANPLDPANLRDLQRRVRDVGADVGLAFDGDADRCFVVDEQGNPVSPSTVTAMVAVRELARAPGSTVVHNLISSRAVPEMVREHGGVPVRCRVGHTFVKQEMARTDAVFGGEHSAHYYFRDFWRADTGMLAALHVLAALATQPAPLTELVAGLVRYVGSGEVNREVGDPAAAIATVAAVFAAHAGVELDRLDGLTVTGPDWWFNLRPSNTEPLLRLNVEAADRASMQAMRDQVLALLPRESVGATRT